MCFVRENMHVGVCYIYQASMFAKFSFLIITSFLLFF